MRLRETLGDYALMETLESRIQLSNGPGITHETREIASPTRESLGAASLDNLGFFAGGGMPFSTSTSRVDVYNATNDSWSQASLSLARSYPSGVSVDGKALFAGGLNASDATEVAVDIYDSRTGSWTTARLAYPREDAFGASVGNKAIFAYGGANPTANAFADIYDSTSGEWSSTKLARGTPLMFKLGDKLYISNRQVYDAIINRWLNVDFALPANVKILPESADSLTPTVCGIYALFATPDGFAIFNSVDGQWTTTAVEHGATQYLSSTTVGTKAIFVGGANKRVNIFDSASGLWSSLVLPRPYYQLAATTVGTKAMFSLGSKIEIFNDTKPSFSLNGSFDRVGQNTMAVAIRNVGDADLPAGYTINLIASTGRSFNSRSVSLGRVALPSMLAPGEVNVVNIPLTQSQVYIPGTYNIIAAAVPPGRGHAVLFASILDAFSVQRITYAAVRAIQPSANSPVSPGVFSMQPMHTLEQVGTRSRRDVPDVLA